MPEVTNVVTGETVLSVWGNAIRDRTCQRYADATERTSLHGSPVAGEISYIANTGDVDVYHGGVWRHLLSPVGSMQLLAGGAVPPGWLACNGQAVSRVTYAGLFSQIGTAWGPGDGSSTFNLPDMRGRVPRGVAASGTGDAVGEKFGSDTHVHGGPSHSHTVSGGTSPSGNHNHGGTTGEAATLIGTGQAYTTGANEHHHTVATDFSGNHSHTFSDTSSASGGGDTDAASTIQASAAVQFIIKT